MQYASDFFDDPFGGEGTLVHQTDTKRVWLKDLGNGNFQKCEVENVDPVLQANIQLYNESYNKRWGDGQIVASIPWTIYYSDDFKKARAQQDQKWFKKFLNDSDNQKLRTFRGNV